MSSKLSELDKIKHDIRNIRSLSKSQIEIITDLSDKDKNDIINLYNHVITSCGELIMEEIGSSKSSLHIRK